MAPTCESEQKKSLESAEKDQFDSNNNSSDKNLKDNKFHEFGSLIVAFVGLPARGKTVLAHKLSNYLRWTGIPSEVFSVCDYCRKHIESYNHNMFRADNKEAVEMRQKSTLEAIKDVTQWLQGKGKIAILDGTNPNGYYRQILYENFVKQMGYKLMFIECICDDDAMLERNIKEILQFNVDYKKMKKEVAMNDLRCKIEHFKEQYECLNRRTEPFLSFIKVINGGEDISIHKICGHLQSKVLYYISNFRAKPRTLYFSRHGESEYNLVGRIGGDAGLSIRGLEYAKKLAWYFNHASISGLKIWTSKLKRTNQTVQKVIAPKETLESLNELDSGVCEGLTYEEIQENFPQEFAWRDQDKLHYRYPWGESYIDIISRLEPVLMQLESEDNVLVVSHQAVLRCILSYFLNKPIDDLPYMEVPLHTIIKLSSDGYNYNMELIKLHVDCVNTTRPRPKGCSSLRSPKETLKTLPINLLNLNYWSQNNDCLHYLEEGLEV